MAGGSSFADATVSVIIPVYNAQETLDQCLRSVRGQSHSSLDIICLNDGSTDSSLAIMRRHESEDPRIRVVDKANEGYGATCNRGLDLARGSWIAIVEPDDWIGAKAFSTMLSAAYGAERMIDIVKTPWFDVSTGEGGNEAERPCVLAGRMSASSSKTFSISEHPILLRVHPAIWSALYRTGFLRDRRIRFREFPGAGWADNPFLIETMCQADRILYVDEPFYRYRVDNPASSSHDVRPEAVAIPFDRWTEMLEVLDRLGIEDRRILSAHYARGFNYADDARRRFGSDNELVKRGVVQMFTRMDPSIVRRIPHLSPARRRMFFDVRGERAPYIPRLGWCAHVMGELVATFKAAGPISVLHRIIRR
ncbi:MAG: glycosyltransferase [Coriobacteriaceae bacterium]|nr:glycosyltransferase [Coriobacteriaceae bacterium]